MGGTALGRLANRLTLEQHAAFQTFCKAELAPFFPDIYQFRNLADKQSHGDLDLVCEWDGYDLQMKVKGYEEDLGDPLLASQGEVKVSRGLIVSPEGEAAALLPSGIAPPATSETVDDADNLRIRAWCAAMCKAVHGFGWARNGWRTALISIGVHCKDLDTQGAADVQRTEEQEEQGQEPFWQCDLILIPPGTGPFVIFTTSYGDTLIILSIAVKIISKHLNLRTTELIFKYSPFTGIPGIVVPLTLDAPAFCKWLGLDYEVWDNSRFQSSEELWIWLTSVSEDSRLGKVWEKLANRVKEDDLVHRDENGKVVIKNHKRKVPGLESMLEWLRRPESPWVSQEEQGQVQTKEDLEIEDKTPSSPTVDPIPNPDEPNPLDTRGQEAVTYWGKQGEVDILMADRTEKARYLAERRMAKLANKAAQAHAHDPDASGGSMTAAMETLNIEGAAPAT